jgi:peroxiredoxin
MALAGLLGVLAVVISLRATAADEPAPWKQALITSIPLFTLPDASGTDVPLADQRGRIVLVHFFATWCEPCREELPALNRLSARAGSNVKVIAISVAEADLRVRRFIETMPVNFPVLLDRERAVAKAWNVTTLPTTFVLDANLRPRFVVETDFAWDTFDAAKVSGDLKNTAATNQTTIKQN